MTLRQRRIFLGGILVLCIGALLALQTPLLGRARSGLWNFWVSTVGRVASLDPLEVENDVVSQMATLQAENVRLKAEQLDYLRLREELGVPQLSTKQSVPAFIAGRVPDTFRAELILNKGLDDGVTLNAPVVLYGSVLLGYVVDVSEHSSIVRLLVHPETAISAEVPGKQDARGLLRGAHYTSLLLVTVPRDSDIAVHDPVLTQASDETPYGLLVGYIAAIRNEENEAYQQADVSLLYTPDELQAVQILVAP